MDGLKKVNIRATYKYFSDEWHVFKIQKAYQKLRYEWTSASAGEVVLEKEAAEQTGGEFARRTCFSPT